MVVVSVQLYSKVWHTLFIVIKGDFLCHVYFADPAEMKFPVMSKAFHHYPDNTAPAWMAEANKKLVAADAVVVVSAEYNHSIPPALSNMMDHFPLSSYAFKPSAIVCYSMG